MAASASGETAVGRVVDRLSNGLRCQSSDALIEWRSSEQVGNGTPSTSPSYWDIDDSDDDGGLKPSDLYGLYTWKIEKFSQINEKELRSDVFEVGDYKWYILIYPQGCDVCNHLSLFLCVGNHDKLLPGWSHSAQFTIAVVNKDPKKSKYSDTLHRFCKKEHDWGWKRFMELSKVSDGFVDADTLIIKAQVQVIREKVDRPFRCLDRPYRRELVRVYLTNVEPIFRSFVEERRGKLGKLIEDKAKWSSFCAFWLGMDQNTRHRMSKEKKDMILKVAVKHFFIEKEVTSTLVMDSLYSGLKALEDQSIGIQGKVKLLEGEATTSQIFRTEKDMDSLYRELKPLGAQSKGPKRKVKFVEVEETPSPVIRIEKDMFVLVDDVLSALERATVEPLPPKDDKGPQNRTKDGGIGEDFSRDSLEHDDRHLTELGRRTVEIFVLSHIFSNKIEVAYQEAVSLKRQEELIREEEAAWLAESEQKAKRGVGEKDKKSKKKQGKQKRNNRKGKDKSKDDKQLHENLSAGGEDLEEPQIMTEKDDALEDLSDVSDIAECAVDMPQPNSKDRNVSPVNWDMDTSEIQPRADASGSEISSVLTVQNGVDRRSSVFGDSSSICSTDSAPLPVMNGSYKSSSLANYKSQKSPTRTKNQQGKSTVEERTCLNEADSNQSEPAKVNSRSGAFPNRKIVESNKFEGAITSLQDRIKWPELNAFKKVDKALLQQRKQNNKDINQMGFKDKNSVAPGSSKIPPENLTSVTTSQPKPDMKAGRPTDAVPPRKTCLNEQQQTEKATSSVNTFRTANASRVDSTMTSIPKQAENLAVQQSVGLSRPSSAPIISATSAAVSMVQVVAPSASLLPRSVSATGRLSPDPSHATAPTFVPHSYRNPVVNTSTAFCQQPTLAPNPVFLSHTSERMESYCASPGISFPTTSQGEVLNGQAWMDSLQRDISRGSMFDSPPSPNVIPHFDLYHPMNNGSHGHLPSQLSVCTSGCQVQSTLAEEFPHLDIINGLLDDEQVIGRTHESEIFPGTDNGPTTLFNNQFAYPTDLHLSSDNGSVGSSCRFDRFRSCPEDGFQQNYALGRNPQSNSIPCMNGEINSLVPNQWQLPSTDLLSLGLTSSGVDGYSYNIHEYAMFPSSNGR